LNNKLHKLLTISIAPGEK